MQCLRQYHRHGVVKEEDNVCIVWYDITDMRQKEVVHAMSVIVSQTWGRKSWRIMHAMSVIISQT